MVRAGGQVTVRVNSGILRLEKQDGTELDLVKAMHPLNSPGVIGALPARAPAGKGTRVEGRICGLRRSEEAVRLARAKIHREASRKGRTVLPATLELAKYVILFTTVSRDTWSASDVLEWYRTRWQVELVFKRFKSLAQLGSLPKSNDDSAKAWLYGKLLAALLVEKLSKSRQGGVRP